MLEWKVRRVRGDWVDFWGVGDWRGGEGGGRGEEGIWRGFERRWVMRGSLVVRVITGGNC